MNNQKVKNKRILSPKEPGRYQGEYRGIRYIVQVARGISVYQGYDSNCIRIIYALSAKEFQKKADSGDFDNSQRELHKRYSKYASFRKRIAG